MGGRYIVNALWLPMFSIYDGFNWMQPRNKCRKVNSLSNDWCGKRIPKPLWWPSSKTLTTTRKERGGLPPNMITKPRDLFLPSYLERGRAWGLWTPLFNLMYLVSRDTVFLRITRGPFKDRFGGLRRGMVLIKLQSSEASGSLTPAHTWGFAGFPGRERETNSSQVPKCGLHSPQAPSIQAHLATLCGLAS